MATAAQLGAARIHITIFDPKSGNPPAAREIPVETKLTSMLDPRGRALNLVNCLGIGIGRSYLKNQPYATQESVCRNS